MPLKRTWFASCPRITLAWTVVFVGIPAIAAATTYFVDPVSGANGNNGISATTPWLNPPGTRTANSSGFFTAAWGSALTPGGAITTTHKIACGDVILLKGGSTQTSVKGGSWWITPTYYTRNCTTGSRITIRIGTSAEWSGSTGHFTLDGAGVTASCDSTVCATDKELALVNVGGVNFIEIKGLSNAQRFVVTNAVGYRTADCVSIGCPGGTGCLGRNVGFRGDWWDINHCGYYAVAVGATDNWQISNINASFASSGALVTGFTNDWGCNPGAFVNATVSSSGCGSAADPSCSADNSGQADGFNLQGGENVWCVNCTVHDVGERGATSGVINNANMISDWHYHWRNFVTYSNGATCGTGGHPNCNSIGIRPSGNDWFNSARSRNHIIGLIGWDNAQGCESAYGGAWSEVWNATCYHNGYSGGLAEHVLDSNDVDMRLLNSIDQLANGTTDTSYSAGTSDGSQPQQQFTPTALNNCYRPKADNSEALGAAFQPSWPGLGTHASPPAFLNSATNKIGLANCDPKFVALSTSSFAANDFHLQVGSSAIDAGRFFLLANGAGSSAATVTVKANGGWGDPRDFFISPTSYLDAAADTIQIQNATCAAATPALPAGRANIVSMTATTITLDRACSWANGAGIHLPWGGSAPDMGAFESGLTGAVSPPTLLDVQLLN